MRTVAPRHIGVKGAGLTSGRYAPTLQAEETGVLDATARDRSMITGLARGLAVIEAFSAERSRLSIAEVARVAGLERATTRRCLLTLAQLGYADHDGKFFTLTPKVLRLGHAYLAATPLPKLVQPFLEQLAAATGEDASASILDGTEIVYIARAAQKRVVSISLTVGSRIPAYCASMGRVLLAALDECEAQSRLEHSDRKALTPHTRTDVDDLMAELALVRREGYSLVDEELEIGLRSIALPILAADGRVLAAFNTGAQAARLSAAGLRDDVLPRMRAIQANLRLLLN